MPFTVIFAKFVLSIAAVSASECTQKLLPANAIPIAKSNRTIFRDEALKGEDIVWVGLKGHVKFTFENNNKVQYHLNLDNKSGRYYDMALAISNKGKVANWVSIRANAGQSLSGCAEQDMAVYKDPETTYSVEVWTNFET